MLLAGNGSPQLRNVLIFTAGVVLMRAAGCIMNDIADRDFDPHVERTRSRPLASGELTLRQALILFLVLMLTAFCLVLMTNALTVKLAFAGALLASSYPFFKRFTHLPQIVLGVAFGWSCVMAFSAETGGVPASAWWLLGANVIWSVIYDTLYAMVDREDDLSIGVKSTAILFGRYDIAMIALLQLSMLAILWLVGFNLELSYYYYLGLLLAALMAVYQQLLTREREPSGCFKAFLNNNYFGMCVFLGLVLHYQLAV